MTTAERLTSHPA